MQHWFAQPHALWLLLLIPFGALLTWLARRRRRRALAELGSGLAFDRIVQRRRGWHRRARALTFTFAMLLLVVGIAGPQWGLDWDQSADPGRDLIVVLDLSRSMLAEDPSRLQQAKDALAELADAVKARGGHRLALVVFAPRAAVTCQLTYDDRHFRNVVDSYDAEHLVQAIWPDEENRSGTRIDLGLLTAMTLFDDNRAGRQDLLLISDGGHLEDDDQWIEVFETARGHRARIFCIGVGDPDKGHLLRINGKSIEVEAGKPVRTRLREDQLRRIADETGGRYERLKGRSRVLVKLYSEEIAAGRRNVKSEDSVPVYKQRYVYFLLPALALLLGALALGEGKR